MFVHRDLRLCRKFQHQTNNCSTEKSWEQIPRTGGQSGHNHVIRHLPHSVTLRNKPKLVSKAREELPTSALLRRPALSKSHAEQKVSYSAGKAGLKSLPVQTELLCCGEALSTVNLRNLRTSHYKSLTLLLHMVKLRANLCQPETSQSPN